jgi:hypothetical protein
MNDPRRPRARTRPTPRPSEMPLGQLLAVLSAMAFLACVLVLIVTDA